MVYIIDGAFIMFDFITGLIKAIKEKNFNSSIMREGLYHKFGSMMVVALATLVDYSQNYIDLGLEIDLPIITTVSAYIILMELGSIIENIGKINPNLVPLKVKEYFFKLNDKGGI